MSETEASHFGPERRAQALARCAAATPGPWVWDDGDRMLLTLRHGPHEEDWPDDAEHDILDCAEPEGNYPGGQPRPHDRDFIAYARADLPAALAEIERLEALLRRHGIDPEGGKENPPAALL